MEENPKSVPAKAAPEPKNVRVAQFLAQLGGHKPAVSRPDHDALPFPKPVDTPRTVKDPQ